MTTAPEAVVPGAEETTAAPAGRATVVLRRFVRNKGSLIGAIVIVLLFLAAFVGPLLSKYTYSEMDFNALREAPSATHWLGTDRVGKDIFAVTMRGLQKSLLIGLLVALFSTVLASIVGACAGYFGGWVDRILMFVIDLMLVFPSFLVITIMSPLFKNSSWLIFIVILALFAWMITARVIRSMTLSLKEQEFVRAARFMGVHPFRIIVRHILPNVASFLIIDATIQIGAAVMSETVLSYFGFGIQPPDVSLGSLIASGQQAAIPYPWMFFPAVALLVIYVLAANLIGDGLRDALDPTSDKVSKRQRRQARKQQAEQAAASATTEPATNTSDAGSAA